MARPRKLETLTMPLSVRIRNAQHIWLTVQADHRFDGEMSRAVRWAIDQAQVFDQIMRADDPVAELAWLLDPPNEDPEEEVLEAERELEAWRREQAIKRAQKTREKK